MKEYRFIKYKLMNRTIRVMIVTDDLHFENLPLLIMQDGQNLFKNSDASYKRAWNFQRQWVKHDLPCMVIAGIDCLDGTDRLDEYSPFVNSEVYKTGVFSWINGPVGGKAQEYANFIVKYLLPDLKQRFPISHYKKDIALGGSSMGGLFSLYTLLKHPKYFTKAACLSPSFWFAPDEIKDFITNSSVEHVKKLYLDMGTNEHFDTKEENADLIIVREVTDLLSSKGIKDKILYQQIGGASHNEASWEKRIATFIEYLFGKQEK